MFLFYHSGPPTALRTARGTTSEFGYDRLVAGLTFDGGDTSFSGVSEVGGSSLYPIIVYHGARLGL